MDKPQRVNELRISGTIYRPQIKQTSKGAITTFSMKVASRKDRNDQWKSYFMDVTMFSEMQGLLDRDTVLVKGKLSGNTYTPQGKDEVNKINIIAEEVTVLKNFSGTTQPQQQQVTDDDIPW